MRSFYLTGDNETRSLVFAPVHLHMGLIELDKAGKKELRRLAELDYDELADYVMSKDDRAMKLVLGKIAVFDEQNKNSWANGAWIPNTDKVVEFPEVEDWELQESFRAWSEREKKKRHKAQQEKEAAVKKKISTLPKRRKFKKHTPEPEPEEQVEIKNALNKLKSLKKK